MLIVRLKPQGKKHRRQYRIVVADKKRHVSKKSQKDIGFYDPHTKEFKIDKEKLQYYYSLNIEMSDRVKLILKQNDIELKK